MKLKITNSLKINAREKSIEIFYNLSRFIHSWAHSTDRKAAYIFSARLSGFTIPSASNEIQILSISSGSGTLFKVSRNDIRSFSGKLHDLVILSLSEILMITRNLYLKNLMVKSTQLPVFNYIKAWSGEFSSMRISSWRNFDSKLVAQSSMNKDFTFWGYTKFPSAIIFLLIHEPCVT